MAAEGEREKLTKGALEMEVDAGGGKQVFEEDLFEEKACSTAGVAVFAIGLVSGTLSAVLAKVAYDTPASTLENKVQLFQKPVCLLLLMFLGMCPAGVLWLVQQAYLPPEKREKVSSNTLLVLIIPCVCDLFCTLLLLVAQVYITASIWQMLRGSVIVITAILKRYVMDHKLRGHMWLGVTTITISMLLVAASSLTTPVSDDDNATTVSSDPRLGVTLVIIGCLAQGVQYVFEEKVMADDDPAPPLVVIGMEGLWGTALSLFVIYPLAYILPGSDVDGCFENPWNDFYMISSSPVLPMLVIGFVLTVTAYNCSAIYVTSYLSSVWHAILDNFRPITIWGLDLFIFYQLLPGSSYGEQWLSPGSYIQLGGLAVLLAGTAIYNGNLGSFDIFEGPDSAVQNEMDDVKTLAMSSPSISRSPLLRQKALKEEQEHLLKIKQIKMGGGQKKYAQDV